MADQSNLNYEFSFNAGGNIAPASIVKWDTTADEQVLQSTATSDPMAGVVYQSMKLTPGLTGSDTTKAYVLGDKVRLVGYGNPCVLQVDSGAGVTAGDLLTSGGSVSGLAVTAAAGSGKIVVAIATQTVGANGYVRCIAICPRIA